jgi:hypothetical protein
MQEYLSKSHEELRLEDYQANCKGKAGAQFYPSVHPSKVPTGARLRDSLVQCMCLVLLAALCILPKAFSLKAERAFL